MENESARKWWKKHLRDYNEFNPFDGKDKARKTEWNAIFNAFKLNPSEYPKIVDLGCGTGRFSLSFSRLGFETTGIDISKEALDILKRRATKYNLSKRIHVLHSGLYEPVKELEEGKFDAGYMIVTYHCISNDQNIQKKVFRNFARLIRKKGKILIMEPNPLNPLFYIFYLFIYRGNLSEGFNIINSRKGILYNLLKETGFSNIQLYRHSFFPTFLINRFEPIKGLNKFLCSVPGVKNFCAFHIITAVKS